MILDEQIRTHLNDELEDDNSVEWGGTAFAGEKLSDFIAEYANDTGRSAITMSELNIELKECGIRPVAV